MTKAIKPGTILDHYKFVRFIGEGGENYQVWQCEDLRAQNRPVAMKIFHCRMDERDLHRETLINLEKQLGHWINLNHANIVTLFTMSFDIGGEPEPDGKLEQQLFRGFVMEYSSTGDTAGALAGGKFDLYTAKDYREFFKGICRGIRYTHSLGLIHRDLKPQNILLFEEQAQLIPKISDFGLTILESEAVVGWGTPPYMAPEQFDRKVTKKSDVYALGIIFYQILTRELPFQASGTTREEIFRNFRELHQKGARPRAIDKAPECHEKLSGLIERMMSIDENERPAIEDVLKELDEIEWLSRAMKSVGPISKVTISPPFKEHTYRWNSNLHLAFGESLYFFWFRGFVSFTIVSSALKEMLSKQQLNGYAMYNIYGNHDYLIRIWCTEQSFRQLCYNLSSLEGLMDGKVKRMNVSKVNYLAHKEQKLKYRDLPSLARDFKSCLGRPDENLEYKELSKRHFIFGRNATKNHSIKGFTALKFRQEYDQKIFEAVLEKEIREKFDVREWQISFYSGNGDYDFLVKFVSNDYFRIAQIPNFVQVAASAISARVRTDTFLCVDREFYESDDGELAQLIGNY